MAEEKIIELNTDNKGRSLSLSGKPESQKSLSRINAPAAPLDPDKRFEKLLEIIRNYHPSSDISEIQKAYDVAKEAHGDQRRRSGELYITHPVEVAIILAELEMDKETIIAGLLHDVVEDTDTTLESLKNQFNEEVAELVDGVTKLTQIKYSADKIEVQAENLRKMFLAMAKDIRVIIIKLADRLHNMRTLQYMDREKQKEKARETMDIYSPIAQRLGISKIKIELDDLALKYSEPDVYYNLVENIKIRRSARENFVSKMVEEIKKHMEDANITCEVDGRVKHFFSIYKKMINQSRSLDQIYDLFAVRIKVETVKDCYAALGIIHEVYKPIPGRFKDYIAMPKPNMYQSLHTTLISHSGHPFEVQIRTFEMHRTAEYGIAAHWKYKEGIGVNNKTIKQSEEEKLAWLRQILDWQNEMSDNKEFMEFLKSDLDLFSDNVFCFTPQGDVKNLPAGSTPIDFAYAIHSAVGNKMIGARVNDKIVTIDYKIQNGDRIEIITSQNSKGPSMDWLNIVKSPSAKQKINQWFRNALKEENIVRGKELVDKYMKSKGLENMDIFQPEYQAAVLARYSCKDWDSVLAAIGHGGLKEGQVVNRVLEEYNRKNKINAVTDEDVLGNTVVSKPESELKHRNGIVVKGIHDVAVRFAKCCSPVPGDEIVGFVTRGRGITVHRTDCINIVNLSSIERSRLIDAQWDKPSSVFKNEKYQVEISLYARKRTGLLVDISKFMSEKNLDVTNMNVRINKQQIVTIDMGFKVSSTDELSKVIEKLKSIDDVIDITRTTG